MAYAVHGYPADCVLIALTGLLVDEPPDLVVGFGVRRSEQRVAGREVWVPSGVDRRPAPSGTDVDALARGRLAVTTMQADEQDLGLLRQLQERVDELPAWGQDPVR